MRVVDYDERWPAAFERERAAIEAAIGRRVAAIEHVGSTAVSGCAAKPVIDIMVGIDVGPPDTGPEPVEGRNLLASPLDKLKARVRLCVAPLTALGYEYRGEQEIPGWHYFPKGLPRSHQVHMVARGGEFWRDHLLFRDYLRAHPDAVQAYSELKRELARRHRSDRVAYMEAKSPFVEEALARARRIGPPSKGS